ncbi:MAG: DNA-processing protein DprA [bacterium]
MSTALTHWLTLNQVPGIGPVTFRKLVSAFGSVDALWQATRLEFLEKGLSEQLYESIVVTKATNRTEATLKLMEKHNISAVTYLDPLYPQLLTHVADAPVLLFYKGLWDREKDALSLGVVGTRAVSEYGKQVTQEFVRELCGQGITIVSGLALGIDTVAHQTAVLAKGRTIAVLGCGVDIVYPSTNYQLADRIIAEGGMIVSEYLPGTPVDPAYFPQRNRIISGLSLGTLVVEAAEKSGALITATYALEQNREVFAVPNSIYTPNSAGCNRFIAANRAKLVRSANDILDELHIEQQKAATVSQLAFPEQDEESQLVRLLSKEALPLDAIIRESELPASVVSSTLTMLLLKGKVRDLGNNMFVSA